MASPDETEQERHGAAHHEAGHAVAALKRGREIHEICIHPVDGHTAFQETVDDEDFAFIVHGGPWAQARYLQATDVSDKVGLPSPRRVAEMFAFNRSDWLALEEATGGDVEAVRTYLDHVERASLERFYEVGDDEVCDSPGVSDPQRPALSLNPAWSDEMDQAWPEVQDLVAMLLGLDREIRVGLGEPLVLLGLMDGHGFWRQKGWTPTDNTSCLKH